MAENKHTISDLYQMQSLPLSAKIAMTERRIEGWIDEFGTDGVYVSFSGGKDSTVLLDIVRNRMGYKEIPAVFVDVPTQYPELKEFAKTWDNLVILKPKISFMEVCKEYGFPIFSKEIADTVYSARKWLDKAIEQKKTLTDGQTDRLIANAWAIADMIGVERRAKKTEAYEMLKSGIIPSYEEIVENIEKNINTKYGYPVRLLELYGKVPHKEKGVLTSEYSKIYDKSKYLFMLGADFDISDKCCAVMKKAPIKKYAKETGRKPITAQMASESKLRASQWVKFGCNGFEMASPISNPMSFWTEQDVLLYIKQNNIPICSVYGDIVEDLTGTEEVQGQMTISDLQGYEDMGIFDAQRLPLKTTGCNRTGCILCGFGCHLEKEPNRFQTLKETHPKLYGLLDVIENNGVTYREAIDWINEHGKLNIKY